MYGLISVTQKNSFLGASTDFGPNAIETLRVDIQLSSQVLS